MQKRRTPRQAGADAGLWREIEIASSRTARMPQCRVEVEFEGSLTIVGLNDQSFAMLDRLRSSGGGIRTAETAAHVLARELVEAGIPVAISGLDHRGRRCLCIAKGASVKVLP